MITISIPEPIWPFYIKVSKEEVYRLVIEDYSQSLYTKKTLNHDTNNVMFIVVLKHRRKSIFHKKDWIPMEYLATRDGSLVKTVLEQWKEVYVDINIEIKSENYTKYTEKLRNSRFGL